MPGGINPSVAFCISVSMRTLSSSLTVMKEMPEICRRVEEFDLRQHCQREEKLLKSSNIIVSGFMISLEA